MYLAAVIIVCGYALWWFAARREQTEAAEERLLRPFCKMARLLCGKVYSCRGSLPCEKAVVRDLLRLHPSCGRQRLMDYFVRKIGIMLAVLLLGVLFSVLVRLQADAGVCLSKDGMVRRGELRDGEQTLVLEADVKGVGRQMLELAVAEKALTREAVDLLYQEFIEDLLQKALGKNDSWQEIRTDLDLADDLEGYPFLVSWHSSSPGLMSDTGLIGVTEGFAQGLTQENGARVVLTAETTYRNWEWTEQIKMTILPPKLTEQQERQLALERLAAEAEEAAREEERFALPGDWQEHPIIWRQKTNDNSLLFLVLSISACAAVYFLADRDLHQQAERRKQELREMYPVVANKLVLFMGAGMTVRGAVIRIGEDYRRRREAGRTEAENAAYEEILYTCHELQAGTSEGTALEHLGRRTALQEYTRLCTLLMQNLKKGNQTLLCRLREESEKAMQEQINHKRQAGEEASTKLLVPMVMMLAVVMVIIMIPAFSSFGI